MQGQLYINGDRVGDAKLEFSYGHAGAIQLQIHGAAHNREYILTEGDVYVQGARLGLRGFVAIDDTSARSQRRPVLMTFELIPTQRSFANTARRFAARIIQRLSGSPNDANSDAACAAPRSLRTGTAAR